MSLSSHVQELKKKHQNLSDSVEVMQRSPATDAAEIAQMKKTKADTERTNQPAVTAIVDSRQRDTNKGRKNWPLFFVYTHRTPKPEN